MVATFLWQKGSVNVITSGGPTLGILAVVALQLSVIAQRTVHVIVPLCDNAHQGIIPVPASLGNGQEVDRNLYWGAAYGVRTWFDKQPGWVRVERTKAPAPMILERLVWQHKATGTFLVADAYDGQHMDGALKAFFRYSAGHDALPLQAGSTGLRAGGSSDLIAFCGHNRLMELEAPQVTTRADTLTRQTVVLACMSARYFAVPLRPTGAQPLLWTTNYMAPEAYTLSALLDGWLIHEPAESQRERAAAAYARWQKCSMNAARKLLITGW